jgi:hypothetical protein
MLVYDCEIKRAIPGKNEVPIEGIEYCKGWGDLNNMGISCIGAYDYQEDRYRLFCQDNLCGFQTLVESVKIVVGFNSIGFDNKLCAAHGIRVPLEKSYDILVEAWAAAGLGSVYQYPSHIGFCLNAICKANFGFGKSGHGSLAPVQWQRGEIGAVIDYCLKDVMITKMIFDHIIKHGWINDPRDSSKRLEMRRPSII